MTTEPESPATPAGRGSGRLAGNGFFDGGVGLPAIIVLAGLAVRLAFVFVFPRALLWPDPREYEEMGRLLYEHGTYGLQTLRAPGYPTLIAGIYALFGPDLLTLRLVEAFLSAAAIVLIGVLGARLFGRTAGLVAAALTAFHPMLAFLPATQYSESSTVLLLVLALISFYAALERGGWRWASTGLLLGLVALVRPNAIAFLPGLTLGAVMLLHRAKRGWLVPVAVMALAFVATVTPWIVRNHEVHHQWFFITTGGGRQLYFGNNEHATASTTEKPYIDPRTRSILDTLGVFRADRWMYADAQRFMREHPGRAALLYVRKLGNIFSLYPETLTQLYVNMASRISQGFATVLLYIGLLMALARIRREPAAWPLALGSLSFVLATALVFTVMRYRMFIEPCLVLMAGSGYAAWWRARRPSADRIEASAWPRARSSA